MVKNPSSNEDRIISAVKPEAPLVGAPVEYLAGPDGEKPIREVTIPLKFPFKIDNVEYREVTARKLDGANIFAINRASQPVPGREPIDPQAALFSVMLKIPVRAVNALDAEDIKAISDATANFTRQLTIEEPEPTGENGENTSLT